MSRESKDLAPKRYFVDLFGNPIEERGPREELLPLEFESARVCIAMIRGEPWWRAVDVCRALGLVNPTQAVSRLDDDEKTTLTNAEGRAGEGPQSFVFVSESGLYALIFRSRKPAARRFRKWVTSEVLPEIRRTGTYSGRKDDRVNRTARRIRSDIPTAKIRVKLADTNLGINKRLAKAGACPRDFQGFHNAALRGLTGLEAPELRKALGLPRRRPPADRMSPVVLSAHQHAKVLVDRLVAESPSPVPFAEQERMMEEVARSLVDADLVRFGPEARLAVTDLTERGRVLDVARVQVAAN